jgi:HSP20 family protein
MKTNETKGLVKAERPGFLSPLGDVERWLEEAWRRPFSLLRGPSLWPRIGMTEMGELSTSVDVYEEGDDIVVKADLPGMSKKDIEIDLTDDTLTITGEKKKEEKLEEKNYYRYERSYGSFTRRVPLPVEVQTDKAKAHFENGVLEIRIPKSEEAKKKEKKVPID